MRQIDFWFSIGSTYTYLTVMRLHNVEQESGMRFNWRPFSVRVLMQEMNNIPFKGKPAKEQYMWRDLERRAAGPGRDRLEHGAPGCEAAAQREIGRRCFFRRDLVDRDRGELLERDAKVPRRAIIVGLGDGEHRRAVDVTELFLAGAVRVHQPGQRGEVLARGKSQRGGRLGQRAHAAAPHGNSSGIVQRVRRSKPAPSHRCRYSLMNIVQT